MEIKIGESIYLGGDSVYKLSPPVQGLESAAIRVGDGIYAGRDGGYVSGHFYGHRTLVLKGFYIGKDCEEASELRRILFGLLRIRYKLPIIITTAEAEFYTEGFVTDIKSDIENLKAGEFQITILCPDPILYESKNEEEVWYEETLSLTEPTPIANYGDVEAYPVITVNGAVDGIEIINNTTQLVMQIDIETDDNDEMIINMKKRTITLNGLGINEYRSLGSSWWTLLQEGNDIIVQGGSAGSSIVPEATVTIKYRKGFSGI